MPSSTLLNDLFSKDNPDNYCRETLVLLRKFIASSYDLFQLDKKIEQAQDEFDALLLSAVESLLINFYLLHQRLFIELKFSSFRDVVDYFQGIQFHPCFDCFGFLFQVPGLMSGLSVDEKQQVILNKAHIPYLLLKQFYIEHRVKMLKRICDYEQVEKKGYKKAVEAYQLFKRKVITTQEASLDVSMQALILELKSFASFALVLSEVQCIYKVINRWAKETSTTLIRKLVLDIETASISINLIALGSGRLNDLIRMELLTHQTLTQYPIKITRPCTLITGQEVLSFNQKIQDKAQELWGLLELLKQKQYADPGVTGTLKKAMGNLAQLTNSDALMQKIRQLQKQEDSNATQEIIKDYFASIQDPTLANLLSALWRLLAKEDFKEQRVFGELQRIFKNRHDDYHTSLPGLYSFQLVNKHALMKDHTEKGKRT